MNGEEKVKMDEIIVQASRQELIGPIEVYHFTREKDDKIRSEYFFKFCEWALKEIKECREEIIELNKKNFVINKIGGCNDK